MGLLSRKSTFGVPIILGKGGPESKSKYYECHRVLLKDVIEAFIDARIAAWSSIKVSSCDSDGVTEYWDSVRSYIRCGYDGNDGLTGVELLFTCVNHGYDVRLLMEGEVPEKSEFLCRLDFDGRVTVAKEFKDLKKMVGTAYGVYKITSLEMFIYAVCEAVFERVLEHVTAVMRIGGDKDIFLYDYKKFLERTRS